MKIIFSWYLRLVFQQNHKTSTPILSITLRILYCNGRFKPSKSLSVQWRTGHGPERRRDVYVCENLVYCTLPRLSVLVIIKVMRALLIVYNPYSMAAFSHSLLIVVASGRFVLFVCFSVGSLA